MSALLLSRASGSEVEGGVSDGFAVRTEGLGKRYGRLGRFTTARWRSRLAQSPRSSARTGPGKTTLLHLVIGLAKQTAGTVEVLGLSPREDAGALLPRLGFVAQDHPSTAD